MEEEITRHQRKLLKKQERKKAQESGVRANSGLQRRHVVWFFVLAAIVGGAVYGWRYLKATTPEAPYTAGPVHWHAKIDLEVCGEKRDLPGPKDGQMVGNHLYHHHGDNTWHMEGRIIAKEDIALGRFLDEHKIPFDRDRILDKKSGDVCKEGDAPGQVKMFVNGQPNEQFRDFVGQYTPNGEDTVIRIVFE